MLTSLKLNNFRNFKKKSFEFDKANTVIVGQNASGKTNLLEAIYLLSSGKSFKARLEEEMIGYDDDIARISGTLEGKLNATALEIVLTRGQVRISEDPDKYQKTPKKKLMVNGVSRRVVDFTGKLLTVLFGPWDMDLVTESPSIRRKFLDNLLSQVDREYRRAILSYEKGLRQRNRLLLRIREEGLSRSTLLFWDQLLIKNGNYISRKREEFLSFANDNSDMENFDIHLRHSNVYEVIYDPSQISEGRLEQYKEGEVAAATTLVGPHRDDFVFKIRNQETKDKKERDLAAYGSRGEQRMGVLWLKMSELKYIEKVAGEIPTLLLDDIFSELDHEHRDIVMNFVRRYKHNGSGGKIGQVIISTADEHFLEDMEKFEVKIIKLYD